MKTDIVNKVSRTACKVGMKIKKHSPEILIVAGVVGTVASTVMACKATTKLSGILEDAKEDLDVIHGAMEDDRINVVQEDGTVLNKYTPEDQKKDLVIVYAKTGVELAKLYAPSVILGALSLTAIVTSHRILTKRNVALAAAYTAVDRGFKDYRGRVVERFGEALDKELKYGIKAKEIEEVVVDEKGKEKTVKKTIEVVSDPLTSPYARFYDDGCLGWRKDPEDNLLFLRLQQDYANERLQKKGHLFLNEVYDMLGIPRSKAGQHVGWIYDEKHPIGDNYVDFGIYNTHIEANRNFVNGYERTILLDFNVDGDIIDKM